MGFFCQVHMGPAHIISRSPTYTPQVLEEMGCEPVEGLPGLGGSILADLALTSSSAPTASRYGSWI